MKQTALNKLKKKYPFDKFGVWHVLGEEPNCDMGGAHHQPSLGYVQGIYGEVFDWAIEQRGFWQWGAGGSIILVKTTILSYLTEEEAMWARLNSAEGTK